MLNALSDFELATFMTAENWPIEGVEGSYPFLVILPIQIDFSSSLAQGVGAVMRRVPRS